MHELLRQFAAQKLDADSGAVTRTRDRHSAFYLGWLQRNEPALKDRRQLATLDEIEREFENVRGTWDWALQYRPWEQLRKSALTFTFFMAIRASARGHRLLADLAWASVADAPSCARRCHATRGCPYDATLLAAGSTRGVSPIGLIRSRNPLTVL
jgi:hypothetical protein